jgi:hypothetical protein
MTITLAPEIETQVLERARAEGLTVDQYIERLIHEEDAWGELEEEALSETRAEFSEIQAAVGEGLAQAERAEARPAKEVFKELRSRHGIPG